VNVLDILLDKDQPQSLSRFLRRMVTVQESEPAARAVRRLRAARLGVAAVVDQKRNLIGFVTSEDLVARLVRA
jgi:CBS domain containing-hemolysin-like protein